MIFILGTGEGDHLVRAFHGQVVGTFHAVLQQVVDFRIRVDQVDQLHRLFGVFAVGSNTQHEFIHAAGGDNRIGQLYHADFEIGIQPGGNLAGIKAGGGAEDVLLHKVFLHGGGIGQLIRGHITGVGPELHRFPEIAHFLSRVHVLNGGGVRRIQNAAHGAVAEVIAAMVELVVALVGGAHSGQINAVFLQRFARFGQVVHGHKIVHINAILLRHGLVVHKASSQRGIGIAGDRIGDAVDSLRSVYMLSGLGGILAIFSQQLVQGQEQLILHHGIQGGGQAGHHDVQLFIAGNAQRGGGRQIADEDGHDIHRAADLFQGDLVQGSFHVGNVPVFFKQTHKLNADFIGFIGQRRSGGQGEHHDAQQQSDDLLH